MPTRLLSISEVADILGMTYTTCRGLIKAGQIKSTIIGKHHKVCAEWVEQYIKMNRYEPERVFHARKPGRKPKKTGR